MITTTNARIEVRTDTLDAFADINRACSGYVSVIKFIPAYGGGFFLAHRIEDPKYKALIIAPSGKWAGDVTNEGWVIEYEISDTGLSAKEPATQEPSATPSPTHEKLAREIDDLYEAPSRIRLLRRILEREFGESQSVGDGTIVAVSMDGQHTEIRCGKGQSFNEVKEALTNARDAIQYQIDNSGKCPMTSTLRDQSPLLSITETAKEILC